MMTPEPSYDNPGIHHLIRLSTLYFQEQLSRYLLRDIMSFRHLHIVVDVVLICNKYASSKVSDILLWFISQVF